MEGVDERLLRTGALAGGSVLHRDPRPVDHLGVDSGLSTPEVLDSLTELSSVIKSQLSVWTKTYARGLMVPVISLKPNLVQDLGNLGTNPRGATGNPLQRLPAYHPVLHATKTAMF